MRTWKDIFVKTTIVLITIIFVACSSSSQVGTGVGNSSDLDSAASAVANVFSSGATASISAQMAIAYLEAEEEYFEELDCEVEDCTCVYAGDSNGPAAVQDTLYGVAGTYGSAEDPLAITVDDFCELEDGTENSGLDLVAAFELTDDIEGSCDNADGLEDTIVMQSGSSGVWKNTNDYSPQIFGHFNFLVNGEEELEINCTIYLAQDTEGTVEYATCTDADGELIVQDSSATCQFGAEE